MKSKNHLTYKRTKQILEILFLMMLEVSLAVGLYQFFKHY